MGCELELLERLELELGVHAARELLADPRHGGEEVLGRDLSLEALEHSEASRVHDLGDGCGEALADAREAIDALQAFALEDLGDAHLARAQRERAGAVGAHPVGVLSLCFEQVGDPFEHVGDVLVADARGGGRGAHDARLGEVFAARRRAPAQRSAAPGWSRGPCGHAFRRERQALGRSPLESGSMRARVPCWHESLSTLDHALGRSRGTPVAWGDWGTLTGGVHFPDLPWGWANVQTRDPPGPLPRHSRSPA